MRSNISQDHFPFVRIHDENTCVGGSHLVHQCSTTSDDDVLSIEDLAERFNVSTKTISRWRDHGLVAQRVVIKGRKRVGFLASAVDRFVHENPERIQRGRRFSQLNDDEHDKLISWARRLAAAGACPALASDSAAPTGPSAPFPRSVPTPQASFPLRR